MYGLFLGCRTGICWIVDSWAELRGTNWTASPKPFFKLSHFPIIEATSKKLNSFNNSFACKGDESFLLLIFYFKRLQVSNGLEGARVSSFIIIYAHFFHNTQQWNIFHMIFCLVWETKFGIENEGTSVLELHKGVVFNQKKDNNFNSSAPICLLSLSCKLKFSTLL